MTLVPVIDPQACSAHGDCEDLAPEIFRVEDVAVIVGDGPRELMMAAAQACPSLAISIFEQETGAQVYP
jgi:ferredoxin